MISHFNTAKIIAKLLDSEFKIFNFRIGLDPLLGLIPGIGDVISTLLSLYIVWVGFQMKLPPSVKNELIRNVIFDFVLGLIPVVGDVGDFFFKANRKNILLLEKYAHTQVIEGSII